MPKQDNNAGKENRQKKECVLKLGKVTYGDIPIEQAFKEALAPYFDPEQAEHLMKRHG